MANPRLLQLFAYTSAAAASAVCLLQLQTSGYTARFVSFSLMAIAAYAILGLLKTVTCNETLEELHQYSISALPFVTIPFLATEVWLKHNVLSHEVAYAHAFSGVLLAIITMLSCGGQDISDFVVLANAFSTIYIGYYQSNLNAIYAGGLFIVAHFTNSRCEQSEIEGFYNYFIAAYSYFSLMAVLK